MNLLGHSATAALGAVTWYGATGDLASASAFWMAGVLIDLDHWPDFWRDRGFRFQLGEFWGHFVGNRPPKLWLIGHAWEWLPVLALLAWGTAMLWIWAVAAGLALHLVLDQATNGFRPLGYSIIYRATVGWDSDRIFVEPTEISAQPTNGQAEPTITGNEIQTILEEPDRTRPLP